MVKQNRNFRKGSKPTIHNQNKQFNPKKYGPTWEHIKFELRPDNLKIPEGANQPIIGTLFLGECGHIDLTYTECTKIIDTLHDGQYASNIAQRLGALAHNAAGAPKENEKLTIRRMN